VDLTDADAMEAASRLTDRQRLAIWLVCVRGLSIREAARTMGVSHVRGQALIRAARENIGLGLLDRLPPEEIEITLARARAT
jgi:DNA-directed RNA polymerase specialized sigma24 family protein